MGNRPLTFTQFKAVLLLASAALVLVVGLLIPETGWRFAVGLVGGVGAALIGLLALAGSFLRRHPKVAGVLETAGVWAIVAFIVGSVLWSQAGAIRRVLGITLVLMFSMWANAISALTTVRGLLLLVVIILFGILQQLIRMNRSRH